MIRILKYGEVSNEEIFARSMPTVNVEETVAEILRNVKERGDAALREYTAKFDHAEPGSLTVTPEETEEALAAVEPEFLEILERAAENIRKFHSRQVRNSFIINDEPADVSVLSGVYQVSCAQSVIGLEGRLSLRAGCSVTGFTSLQILSVVDHFHFLVPL